MIIIFLELFYCSVSSVLALCLSAAFPDTNFNYLPNYVCLSCKIYVYRALPLETDNQSMRDCVCGDIKTGANIWQ